ncbi:response regulator [Nostocaceae cyanobacterium CENA357]|uniref:Response regulator n=1 Tax=Atlanticothrix silvestris CENA357 TaxID=1725252 RepID=A0A8J7L4B1_9CYAN|nr:response regulator [Atlanticothrix silvestris]MBH8553442.1 response regulator [Atlanticothrix silvestris CENA357]
MTTKRVLVVDNEQYIQEVAKICLETVAGWEVLTASSGQEGINQAAAWQPDVILLDVMMPDMDGITTFEKLQANSVTKKIPVILLTAKIQAADRRRYNQMGIISAIAKPFNPLELAGQIAEVLGWSWEKP